MTSDGDYILEQNIYIRKLEAKLEEWLKEGFGWASLRATTKELMEAGE